MSQDLFAPGRLRVGINVRDNDNPKFRIVSESDTEGNVFHEQYSNDATCPTINFRKARGTVASPSNVSNDDRIVDIIGSPYSSGFMTAGYIRSFVDAAVSSGQRPATRWEFATNPNNAVDVLRMTIKSDGNVGIGAFNPSSGVNPASLLHVAGNSATNLTIQQSTTDSGAPVLTGRKSRGTVASPATVVANDELLYIQGEAYTNAYHANTGAMSIIVDDTVVAGQRPATRLEFRANQNNAGGPTTYMVISRNGNVGISNGLFTLTERPSAHLHVLGETGDIHIHVEKCSTDTEAPLFEGFKSRGTVAARSNVASDDILVSFSGFGYSASYFESGKYTVTVDGAVTNGQRPPGRLDFHTAASGAGTLTRHGSFRTTGKFLLGELTCALTTAQLATFDGMVIGAEDTPYHLWLVRSRASNTSVDINFARSRGSLGTPTNVADGDRLARIQGQAYSGATGWWATAKIDFFVDGAVVDNQRPGSSIQFFTNAPNGAVTERFRIDGTGRLGVGAAPTASGANNAAFQITSSAPVSGIYLGNASNSAANVLDWYEEGTWTPSLNFGVAHGTTGITYSSRTGRYTRIGNRVYAKAAIVLSNKGSSTGIANLSIPVAIANEVGEGGFASAWYTMNSLTGNIILRANSGLNSPTLNLSFGMGGAATQLTDINDTHFNNTSAIYGINLIYECAT